MKISKQISFFKAQTKPKKFFGGALLNERRKSQRPLSTKDSIHFVLRSTWAQGTDSFLAPGNYRAIDQIISRFAKKFGVRVYGSAINSNHIHLLLRMTNRKLYRAFIKAIAGQIASQVMKQLSFIDFLNSRPQSERGDGPRRAGNGINKKSGFWEFRPFSRVISWGRDFKYCVNYLKQNCLEAWGLISYKPRKNHYSAWMKPAAHEISTA